MVNLKIDKNEAKKLFDYTYEVFFKQPRPITGTENGIRAPPIPSDFAHLEKICSEFDLPMDIFYDNIDDVEKNWSNFYEFLLDEKIPLHGFEGETYPALRTISQLYEVIKDFDLPELQYTTYLYGKHLSRIDDLSKKIYLYVMRTRPYRDATLPEQIKIFRESLFMTKKDLAMRTGLRKEYITHVERRGGYWKNYIKLQKYGERIARALYLPTSGGIFYSMDGFLAHRLDKRLSQFLRDKKIPSLSRDRLPRLEHIHPSLKYTIAGLYFILRNYNKGNNSFE